MLIQHQLPPGWEDTEEPGKIQPSAVVGLAHVLTMEPGDIEALRGPAGPQGPQGVPGEAGPAGPQGPAGAALVSVDIAYGAAAVWRKAAHGLGRVPVVVAVDLVCLVDDAGYQVGDAVRLLAQWASGGSAAYPILGIFASQTEVGACVASGLVPVVSHKASGIAVSPAQYKWAFRFWLA